MREYRDNIWHKVGCPCGAIANEAEGISEIPENVNCRGCLEIVSLNAPEPMSIPNDSKPIWEHCIEEFRERNRIGTIKYGTPLQAHNGRDALVDLFQELCDALVYTRQVIEERICGKIAIIKSDGSWPPLA